MTKKAERIGEDHEYRFWKTAVNGKLPGSYVKRSAIEGIKECSFMHPH